MFMCTRVLKNLQHNTSKANAQQMRAHSTPLRVFISAHKINLYCVVQYRFGHKANVWANKIRFYTQINRFERLPGSKLHRQITDSITQTHTHTHTGRGRGDGGIATSRAYSELKRQRWKTIYQFKIY